MRSWREFLTRVCRQPFVFWGSVLGVVLVGVLHLLPTAPWILLGSYLLLGMFLCLILLVSLAYLFPAYWILPTRERLRSELTYWLAAKEDQTGKRVDPEYSKHLIEQFAYFYPAQDDHQHTVYTAACYASLVNLLEGGFFTGDSPFDRPADNSLFPVFKEIAKPFKFYNAPELAAMFGSVVPVQETERTTGTIQSAFQFTPFEQHADRFLPKKVSFLLHNRLEHQVIIAPTGHGKTQLLERQIHYDIEQGHSVIVIDSKTDMVKRLARLDIPNLIIVNPQHAPALNPFRVSGTEEDINRATAELMYFFKALLGNELSGTMGVVLRPLIHLMCLVPHSNLETMLAAIQDPLQFKEYFDELPEFTQRYLEHDFKRITRKETSDAVTRRIYEIGLQSATFINMFNAPTNSLDLFSAMNSGKVVLVSTAIGDKDLSAMFGKFIISQTVAAALKRASLPESQRREAYLYVDEAGPYADEDKTEEIFSTLRSYGVGAVMAFQHFDQLSRKLQATVSQNAAIKFVAGPEAMGFAKELRVTPEFISQQQKGHFAAYVRDSGPAVSVRVPFGTLDQVGLRSGEHEAFRKKAVRKKVIRETTPPQGKAW